MTFFRSTQGVRVEVDGLRELRVRFEKAGNKAHFYAILEPANHDVGEMVDRDSKSRAHSRQMARSVKSNKLSFPAPSGSPVIRVGGGSRDGRWAVGAQFGSSRYKQFPPSIRDGYTVIPAVNDNVGRIEDIYLGVIEKHL